MIICDDITAPRPPMPDARRAEIWRWFTKARAPRPGTTIVVVGPLRMEAPPRAKPAGPTQTCPGCGRRKVRIFRRELTSGAQAQEVLAEHKIPGELARCPRGGA